ncbi:MAG: NADH-quinone oxidoreductase subunit N [Phycisphaerales bacterium]
MLEKLASLWPEMTLFAATCVVMVLGLSPSAAVRRLCPLLTGLALAAAGILALGTSPVMTEAQSVTPGLMPYAKAVIALVGILLTLLLQGVVDRFEEADIEAGRRRFDPLRLTRGEFYAFFLFSMTGLMLTVSADSLIWLFLALELTSLPTYVMVTMSSPRMRAKEAGVKYFFLGALGAAVFLYGFALLYGGTGSVHLTAIRDALATQAAGEGINPVAMTGLIIALLGVGFKVAAVPMHFYTADVYQGAAAPVSAMLAFVPKTAGFVTIIMLAALPGWTHGDTGGQLPELVRVTLWIMAALTMFVGNVLAILQSSVKRMLAYSSVAHSGYMLVGVIAGPGDSFSQSGIAAVLFYLLAYGIMNTGAFAVIASLETRHASTTDLGERVHDEADHLDAYRGLCRSNPVLGWSMVVCALSLLGFPLTLGFFGKLPLFTAGIGAGEIPLVIVLGINSAIAAFYYLRLVALPMFEQPGDEAEDFRESFAPTRKIAGVIAAGGVLVLTVLAGPLMDAAFAATRADEPRLEVGTNPGEAPDARVLTVSGAIVTAE